MALSNLNDQDRKLKFFKMILNIVSNELNLDMNALKLVHTF